MPDPKDNAPKPQTDKDDAEDFTLGEIPKHEAESRSIEELMKRLDEALKRLGR